MKTQKDIQFSWNKVSYRGQRLFNLILSIVFLIISSPVFLVITILVKITSRGPLIYRGLRVGQGGKSFYQLKFRTMKVKNEGTSFTSRDDPRITFIGKILRFFKLDELPQLINVIKGEMAIVGPRPEDISYVQKHYNNEQLRVFSVKPGLTCLVQVRIFPDFTYQVPDNVDSETFYLQTILPQRLKEDLEYIDNFSLVLDIKIIAQTIWCIIGKSWVILAKRYISKFNQ